MPEAECDSKGPYTYQALEGGLSTRLIGLHPATEACSELRCDIIHIDLLDNISFHPPYTALSYAWGSKRKCCVLWCGTHSIPITASLDAALRAVRKSTWTLLIWVDAVCINQDDVYEKNSQVANMFYIYSGATSVLVWLGQDDAEQYGAQCLDWLQDAGRNQSTGLQAVVDSPQMLRFEAFFSRNWFKRRCVIQEVAVAPHTFILCGAKRIAWYDFIRGVAVLHARHDTMATELYHETLAKLCMIETLNQRSRVVPVVRVRPESVDLLQLLFQFDTSDCSDDRDRVFSLIRLGTLDVADLETLSSCLDYSLPTENVYTTVAGVLLKPSDHYALIHLAAAFRPPQLLRSTLPSWVPDWRYRSRFRPLSHSDFNCGLARKGDFRIQNDGSLLIQGHIYDYVADEPILALQSSRDLTDIAAATQSLVEKDYKEELSVVSIHNDPQFDMTSAEQTHFQAYIHQLLHTQRVLDVTKEIKASPDDHQRQAQASALAYRTNTPLNRFAHSLQTKTMRGRKVFSTQKGATGIGPDDVQAGDAVVVVYGARTPFVLRENRNGTGWCVVGDAYVEGITRKAVRVRRGDGRDFVVV